MRRRIIGNVCMGIGNPEPEKFDNQWTDNEVFNTATRSFFDDILNEVKMFKDIGGFDFNIKNINGELHISIGIEPAYKHDVYICYSIKGNKNNLELVSGHADGYYGADIKITREYGKDTDQYKQFKSCVDKHYDRLRELFNEIC